VQTRFHGSNRLEQSHQGWTLAAARSGSAIESAAELLRAAAFGRTIQFFSKVERRLPRWRRGRRWMSTGGYRPRPTGAATQFGKLRSIQTLISLLQVGQSAAQRFTHALGALQCELLRPETKAIVDQQFLTMKQTQIVHNPLASMGSLLLSRMEFWSVWPARNQWIDHRYGITGFGERGRPVEMKAGPWLR